MADTQRVGLAERDVDQAITALKKGAYLLKYGRRGKPKFCPFRLSSDESMLIWYSGKEEKQLKLSHVSRIIPGQRTAIFQRYPRPEKEYQSFSLIYSDRSLDLICKDKDEAEVWFVGLKALISRGHLRKWRSEGRSDSVSSDSPHSRTRRISPSVGSSEAGDAQRNHFHFESLPQSGLVKAFSDIITYTAPSKTTNNQPDSVTNSLSSLSSGVVDNSTGRSSAAETFRVSLSSAVSSSSQGSCHEDFDALGDVFIWGEGIGDGILAGGSHKLRKSTSPNVDAFLPKPLESTVVLDVNSIACGSQHAVLVTRQGEIFSWGEELGGRLGHGVEADVSHPKLIETLSGMNVELVACGEFHTCAVTLSGDLYTWGDGTHNFGLLGHGSEASHYIPKKVNGQIEGLHVAHISCGPWHTAIVTSSGQLFTFGDGTFGSLGHGDHSSTNIPREVETLRGLRTLKVACGVWHTAAVVEIITENSNSTHPNGSASGKLFTWGNGDKGQLGHGNKESTLVPESIASLVDVCFCQVVCGHNITIGLTTTGRVYAMGSNVFGQLGSPNADGKLPTCIEGNIGNCFVEEISCGSYHAAALTSKTEVYTWGKGTNGQLGQGDYDDRNTPTLVEFLKDKQVKSIACGSNFTAVICLHKWVSSTDHTVCSGCHNPFGFRRKRHNCYNCGLVFCKACSSKKSLKASLAPNMTKPYRVCDDCYTRLKKSMESGAVVRIPKVRSGTSQNKSSNEGAEKDGVESKLQGQYSRLSSVDSSYREENSRKLEKNDIHLPLMKNNLGLQWGNFYSSKASVTSFHGPSRKVFSASVPTSRMVSRTTSPVSRRSSPPWSRTPPTPNEVVSDELKLVNDNLSREIKSLRAQVEDLTSKSQHLEAELEKTSRQLKEVTSIATDEKEKCKAAKEVIKALTAQLKDMAERVPKKGPSPNSKSVSVVGHACNNLNQGTSLSQGTSPTSPESGSRGNSKSLTISLGQNKSEWVVQDEPGVYVTLSALPGGGNELKRVRFSRRRFSEDQAEKWWAENRAKVCERHNIRSSEKDGAGTPSI